MEDNIDKTYAHKKDKNLKLAILFCVCLKMTPKSTFQIWN